MTTDLTELHAIGDVQILVYSGKLQEAENLQRKILHILELLQVAHSPSFSPMSLQSCRKLSKRLVMLGE